jgi:integrase
MAEGITTRHSRSCATKRGGDRCSCSPSYMPWVPHPHEAGEALRQDNQEPVGGEGLARGCTESAKAKDTSAPTKQTVKEAAEAMLEAAESGQVRNRSGDPYKPSVIRSYRGSLRRYVLPEIGQVRLSELTRNHVQDLADSLLAEDFKASTVRNAIIPLRVIYRRAVQRGDVAINPTTDLDLPAVRGGRDRIASPEEAARLIAALPSDLQAVWSTAFYGGLRRGELRALRWEHVDLAGGVIRVEQSWDHKEGAVPPKSHKGRRRVPIPAGLRDALTEHRMATWPDGFVFGKEPERVFGVTSLAERADRAWKAAGLDRLTPHEARHTYASLMIAAGVNAKALSEFMGHSSIQVTLDLYGHLMPGAEDEAASLLDALLAGAEEKARSADGGEERGAHRGAQPSPLALSVENPPQMETRRGAGVVERGGLENR